MIDFLYFSCETVINPLLYAFNEVNLEQTSFEEVAKIVGITEVNNCEIFNQDGLSGIRGLFPITSLMSHRYLVVYYTLIYNPIIQPRYSHHSSRILGRLHF